MSNLTAWSIIRVNGRNYIVLSLKDDMAILGMWDNPVDIYSIKRVMTKNPPKPVNKMPIKKIKNVVMPY